MSHTLNVRAPSRTPVALPSHRSHWAILGIVRFWLATIVVCTHIPWFAPVDPLVTWIAQFSGFSAVLSFLVISGYSIANSIAQSRQGFYQRRVFRILPLYVIAILFTSSLQLFIGGQEAVGLNISFHHPSWNTVLCNLVLLQGFLCFPIKTNVVIWTLSIEVFFYLITPLLHRISNKSSLIIAACFSMTLMHGYKILSPMMQLPYYSDLLLGSGVLLLGWAWLLGFWFFFYRHYRVLGGGILICFGILALIAQSRDDLQREPFFIIPYLIACLAVVYGQQLKLPANIERCCLWLGNLSYPLYLIHFPIFLLMFKSFSALPGMVLYCIALAVAIAVEQWFEKPLQAIAKART